MAAAEEEVAQLADAVEKVKIGGVQVQEGDAQGKVTILRKSTETKTTSEKKYLTRFLMKRPSVVKAQLALSKVFFTEKPADTPPASYAIERGTLRDKLAEIGLNVSEEEAAGILKAADFDESTDCQYTEFLTTVGLALISLDKKWTGEETETQAAIAKAYKALSDLWTNLLSCLPDDVEDRDHLTPKIFKMALSASGQSEDNAISKSRINELDKDGNNSIDIAEFLATMIMWVGQDEDEEDE